MYGDGANFVICEMNDDYMLNKMNYMLNEMNKM